MPIKDLKSQVDSAVDYLNLKDTPTKALILGTGMSGFMDRIEIEQKWYCRQIPNWPPSTAPSHTGELILGRLNGERLLILNGRIHFYEGYTSAQVTFPVRVLGALGIRRLFITNASGGLQEDMQAGELVFITDHINLTGQNPLIGSNEPSWGSRFPDMSEAYSRHMLAQGQQVMKQLGHSYRTGVYVGLTGPSLETPAEYAFLHTIGGDIVGMSTIHEVIVARHMNIEVCALSMVSNVCYPPSAVTKTTVDDVISVVQEHAAKMQEVMTAMIALG